MCLELHVGQLHQVPDRHMGVTHRPRVHLLPLLSPRIYFPVLTLHAEIQNTTGQTRNVGETVEMLQDAAVQSLLHSAAFDLRNVPLHRVLLHPLRLGHHAQMALPAGTVPWLCSGGGHLALFPAQTPSPQEDLQVHPQGPPRVHFPVRDAGGIRAPGRNAHSGSRVLYRNHDLLQPRDPAVGLGRRPLAGDHRRPQRLRHPPEPATHHSLLRRKPLPRLPPHELCGKLFLYLHLVGQDLQHGFAVQHLPTQAGPEEGGVKKWGISVAFSQLVFFFFYPSPLRLCPVQPCERGT
ncbi:hypothetical protein SKAU_G00343820 [Synaphobranchus kaupii]|uniref:Uncharacterized protein n=1 Tax=Synaphobranchus kaupii TaxID=118154 RepID=A0A9Q1IHI5_SYNKA|nr:hypothetical protein SKAU_G00343820 [Synaphobranchus kaupii]